MVHGVHSGPWVGWPVLRRGRAVPPHRSTLLTAEMRSSFTEQMASEPDKKVQWGRTQVTEDQRLEDTESALWKTTVRLACRRGRRRAGQRRASALAGPRAQA